MKNPHLVAYYYFYFIFLSSNLVARNSLFKMNK